MAGVSEHDESSVRDFAAEYEQMRLQNKELTEKIEALNQEVYSLRSRTQAAERIQADYQSELDINQQQIVELNASHAVTILKLKEEHLKIYQDLESKLQSLETENLEIQKKHAKEKEEFIKVKKELRDFQDESPVAALKAELQEVIEEHAANRLACVQHQDLNKILLKEKCDLVEELNSTREHLEMTEEKMKIFKNDLMELSERHEELRESYAVLQSELSCLKATPAEDVGRGNSIFAEVEDRRQAMLKKCSGLNKKYSDMKKDYGARCAEISRLKLENLKLRRQWQEEAEERDNRDVWLNDNYEIRIKELVQTVKALKQEEKPVFVNGDSKILRYVEHVVEDAKKEMAELREEMEWRSSQRLNEAKALYIARTEVQTLKTQVMSAHAENIVLRDKLESAEITDIPSPTKTLKRLKEMLDNGDKDSDPFRLKTVSLELSQEPTLTEEKLPCQSYVPNSSPSAIQITESKDKLIKGELLKEELPSEVFSNEIFPSDVLSDEITSSEASPKESSISETSPDGSSACGTSGTPKLPSSSSLPVVCLPRLLKLEMMEKLQCEKAFSQEEVTSKPLHLTEGEIMEKRQSGTASYTSIQDKNGEVPYHTESPPSSTTAFDAHVSIKLEETTSDAESSEFITPSHTELLPPSSVFCTSKIKVEKTTSDDESSEFIQPSLIKPISTARTGKENNFSLKLEENSGSDSVSLNSENKSDGHSAVCKESDLGTEWQQDIHRTSVPRRSILSKVSRPSLVPIDQNSLVRKVTFAENDSSTVPGKEKSLAGEKVVNQSPKKKLVRIPPPKTYKTRVIVSKDMEF